jgi:hypothetical protein
VLLMRDRAAATSAIAAVAEFPCLLDSQLLDHPGASPRTQWSHMCRPFSFLGRAFAGARAPLAAKPLCNRFPSSAPTDSNLGPQTEL